MKKILLLLVVVLLVTGFAVAYVSYSPSSVPFNYDTNQIIGELLGGIVVEAGVSMTVDVNCTDENSDPLILIAISPPIGLYIINTGSLWQIQWTPDILQEGLWYVTLELTDVPSPPLQAKIFTGTIVVQVVGANIAPVIHPLEDSPVAVNVWPQDYQKHWQELKKQGTVMLGPVQIPI